MAKDNDANSLLSHITKKLTESIVDPSVRIGDVVGCLDSMNVLHASAAATTAAVANGVHHLHRHVNHAEISTRRRIVYVQDHLVIDACGHVRQDGAYGRAMRL